MKKKAGTNARGRKATANRKSNIVENFGGQGGFVGFSPFGLPGTPNGAGSYEQVSDTTSLFTNLRWYLVSNFRQLLSELYVEIGLIQTIVDVPVNDGLRGGIEIKSKQLDEGQIKTLQDAIEREGDLTTAGQAAKWRRLFGGAGIIIMTDDQDPEMQLDISKINKNSNLVFRAVDMWELFWDQQNTEGYDPEIQMTDFEYYDYYGEKLHKSRVMKLPGMQAPSFIRPRLRGWGFSCVEALVRSINQYLKATDLTFEVLDEFKVDVYKIKNLVSTMLSPNGQNKVRRMIAEINERKNFQNAVVIDANDDWDHKQLNFAGLAEAQAGIRKQVASDLRMPITKIFGSSDSAGSLGNADQNDMENYNSMVESEVRTPLKFDILRMVEIRCQYLFGMIPDDLEIAFKPLRVLSAVDEETVKTQKYARLRASRDAGEITMIEFRDAANKGNLFDIKLDTAEDALNPDDPGIEEVLDEENAVIKAEGDPEQPIEQDSEKPSSPQPPSVGAKTDGKKENGRWIVSNGIVRFENWEESDADIRKEIAALREEAEKAEDRNDHHKAEKCREKARKLERGLKK